ncbi:MAG: MiaB/RimO family radical SAM methylthiotransferase [Candidatus Omnitrophica bacterium]|nr:MiaB/RimO family radical SAM methylthiotransferase [Candidatus Omnitrophota bacterium]
MNEYDSEVVKAALEKQGYVLTDSEEAADVVILNTCSVREHAENKAFNKLHLLCREKKNGRPNLTVGLMGCMADNYKEKLLKDFPQLDFVAGTRNVMDVTRLVKEIEEKRSRGVPPRNDSAGQDAQPTRLGLARNGTQTVIARSPAGATKQSKSLQLAAISKEGWWEEYAETVPRREGVRAFLPIMTGCDNLCTYCIVPKTRGREVSMRGGEIVDQVKKLADQGYKEIQLLGQNVNSYGRRYVGEDESYRTRKEPNRFPELVAAVSQVPGIERVSWMTSHPKDASRELFEVMRDYPKVTHWFHLPVQSGNNRILKRMGREYTIEEFHEKLELLRKLVPGAAVSTDMIVGFSDETDEEFEETRRVMEKFMFDSAFIFKYSLRKGTPADRLPDNVQQAVKEERHRVLLKLQKEVSRKVNDAWIGRQADVLFSGRSRVSDQDLIGEMRNHKRVVVKAPAAFMGNVKQVRLTRLKDETFYGELCEV